MAFVFSAFPSVFKNIIGRLVTKVCHNKAAQRRLKDGDTTDQTFCSMIGRETDNIKSKLDERARKYLLASIELFEAATVRLNQGFEMMVKTSEGENASHKSSTSKGGATLGSTSDVPKEILQFQQIDLNESAKELLADAKARFREARLESARVFSNDELRTYVRVIALKIQIMATILECFDRPADAVEEFKLCLENLHAIPEVKTYFRFASMGRSPKTIHLGEQQTMIVTISEINDVVSTFCKCYT